MKITNPLSPGRFLGTIERVEDSVVGVKLSNAYKLPNSQYGEYVRRGEIGEFVVVDVGGFIVFGRIVSVSGVSSSSRGANDVKSRLAAFAEVQLLATVGAEGTVKRGIEKYPRLGDQVFAAKSDIISEVIQIGNTGKNDRIPMGNLSIDRQILVELPVSNLFGRHLAVVGSTGSGKSWTLAHLVEEVRKLHGKMILIDATGEFSTMGDSVTHLLFSDGNHASGSKVVGIPYWHMCEADLNAFLNPSLGVQAPKLREAVRSLKLAYVLEQLKPPIDPRFSSFLDQSILKKENKTIADFQEMLTNYAADINAEDAYFDLDKLPAQLENECIWPSDRGTPPKFGAASANELGYISPLISRVNDLLKSEEIRSVIFPEHDVANLLVEITDWLDGDSPILRISLEKLTFINNLREIVVNILGRNLLERARRGEFKECPLVVALDEAHQFLKVSVGEEQVRTELNAFELIAKEGRKYGLTICVATQRPSDLPAGVLSQMGMTIAHRLTDGRDKNKVGQVAAEIDQSALTLLSGLVPGEAVLMGADFPIPVSIFVSKPKTPPKSDGPDYGSWKKSNTDLL